jgi:uncharacterized protein CbrC (UPF0167 family)
MDPHEKRERQYWAAGRLPASCRDVAMLYYRNRESLKQIEEYLELPRGEARRQLLEAGRLLPELMKLMPPRVDPVAVRARGFRYLLDPEAEISGRLDPQPCVVCAEERPGFDLVVYLVEPEGEWDRHYVCEPCLRTGRLAERGLQVNHGAKELLAEQLAAIRPDLSPEGRESLVWERTREVECCTPRPRFQQNFVWPAHCGDYFGYVKQVSTDDLTQLAPGGDGLAFFDRHVRDNDLIEEPAVHWDEGFAPEGFLNVYLWRCLQCGEHLITCDHD